jgi:hypothetical protein
MSKAVFLFEFLVLFRAKDGFVFVFEMSFI